MARPASKRSTALTAAAPGVLLLLAVSGCQEAVYEALADATSDAGDDASSDASFADSSAADVPTRDASSPIDAGPGRVAVTIAKMGDGKGYVDSTPQGILCGDSCTGTFTKGATVTLTARPDDTFRFVAWSPPCGNANPCVFAADRDVTISAQFGASSYTVTATLSGQGSGRVVSAPSGIDCTTDRCTASFPAGQSVMLTARPLGASSFTGWSGACSGTAVTCMVLIDRAQTVGAAFATPGNLNRYTSILDLGALPNGSESWGWAINNSGWTVGWASDASNNQHAFRASPDGSTFTDLGTLGGLSSSAWAVNETGWSAGVARDANGLQHGFLCAPAPSTMLTDLGTLGGTEAVALGVNATNWVVGGADTASGERHVFRRSPQGTMTDLGTLGGTYGSASSINDAGWAVGDSTLQNGYHHAFRVAPSPATTLVDLGTLGGNESLAKHIGPDGSTVGVADIASAGSHAFIVGPSPATGMLDLGTLGGQNSYAYGSNMGGVVVGSSQDAGAVNRAFIWTPAARVLVDLNELLPRQVSGWTLSYATAINDNGVITGLGLHNGAMHAYVLVP